MRFRQVAGQAFSKLFPRSTELVSEIYYFLTLAPGSCPQIPQLILSMEVPISS